MGNTSYVASFPSPNLPKALRLECEANISACYKAIFDDGHHRQLPRLTSGPLKYKTYAYDNFKKSVGYSKGTGHGMKTAVIAPSMLYLLYPLNGTVEGYPKEKFVEDLVVECEKDIRGCFEAGAERVSIDFTEGPSQSSPIFRPPGIDLIRYRTSCFQKRSP